MPLPPARIDPIIASFAGVITPHGRIIDIGAGKGQLALEMAQQFGAQVTMVDVAQYNRTNLQLTVCDSRALAFSSDSFDYALLCFVLHHSPVPEMILGEALRVARQVIVVENDVRGRIRGALTKALDSWPAIRYGTPPCYHVRTRDEWLALIAHSPVEACVLNEFDLEFGFFHNFTVLLTKKEAQTGLETTTVGLVPAVAD
jgi:SAM-dependent methyltransferase